MSEQTNTSIIPGDINALSFDSFGRNAARDVVCLAPIRTVIRREEEITLVRKVRKVEEIDARPACPMTSVAMSSSPFNGRVDGQASFVQPAQPASVNL